MPNVGDILRITSCQTLLGQEVCNIFYYAVAVWTGNLTLTDVMNKFDTAVQAPMSALQSISLEYELIKVDNITDNLEFDQRNVTRFGQLTESAVLPSYVSYGVTLARSSKTTRNGAKRISGVIETAVTGNEQLLSAGLTTPVEDAFKNPLVDDGTGTDFELTPVIVGRKPDGSYDLTRINPIADASFKALITTQNSRKQKTG